MGHPPQMGVPTTSKGQHCCAPVSHKHCNRLFLISYFKYKIVHNSNCNSLISNVQHTAQSATFKSLQSYKSCRSAQYFAQLFALCTFQFVLCTFQCVLCTFQFAHCTFQCLLSTLHCTLLCGMTRHWRQHLQSKYPKN